MEVWLAEFSQKLWVWCRIHKKNLTAEVIRPGGLILKIQLKVLIPQISNSLGLLSVYRNLNPSCEMKGMEKKCRIENFFSRDGKEYCILDKI